MRSYSCVTIVLAFLAGSCTPEGELLKVAGDIAAIKTLGGASFEAELLFCNDSLLYVMDDGHRPSLIGSPGYRKTDAESSAFRPTVIPVNRIESIEIQGYTNDRWGIPFMGFQVLPALASIGIAGSDPGTDDIELYAVIGIPTVLTGILFAVSTPAPPGYHQEAHQSIGSLKPYMRFPEGLTATQVDVLLRRLPYHEFRRIE